MDLYTQELIEYLTGHAEAVLDSTTLTKEARFIVQSIAPQEAFKLFAELENFHIRQQSKQNIKSYFRVASKLWDEWVKQEGIDSLENKLQQYGKLSQEEKALWIDKDDKLTWYRNRTVGDENTDALLIVLVGLNHATDQGGLSDFHKVDDQSLWQNMGESFRPWLNKLNVHLDMNASDNERTNLDDALLQLYDIKRVPLGQTSEFLRKIIVQMGGACSITDFRESLLGHLPLWGVPPLATEQPLKGSKLKSVIKHASEFISHKNYKSKARQDKDWKKIESALDDENSELSALEKECENYRENLHNFIYKADKSAQQALLGINVLPLINTLKAKEETEKESTDKIATFDGMSFESILHGLWYASAGYDKNRLDDLDSIEISLIKFEHDLLDDKASGTDAQLAAQRMLQGCLGGIENLFKTIDFKLPVDSEQQILQRACWERSIPIQAIFDYESTQYKVSRSRPRVLFKIRFLRADASPIEIGKKKKNFQFFWRMDSTNPERVRYEAAATVWKQWINSPSSNRLLPSYILPTPVMAAIYHAADEEEANRLIGNALIDLKLNNMLNGVTVANVDPKLWALLEKLIVSYQKWLKIYIEYGYYSAAYTDYLVASFTDNYSELTKAVLDTNILGAPELMRRIYKSFLLVNENSAANDAYIESAISWGLSPCLLELLADQERFLAEGFPEILANLLLKKAGSKEFKRLTSLAKIHRPLAGLVVDPKGELSAEIRSFGLIHCLGEIPSTVNTLAVQALLREEDEDSEDINDIVSPCEESYVIVDVLKKYQKIYPFAQDGLRIMAANIKELPTILTGVDAFLKQYLSEEGTEHWAPFQCTVMVYSTASSPLTMDYRLSLWRDHLMERHRENGRKVHIKIGHRFTPMSIMEQTIKEERRLYDIAFLFNFLSDPLHGKIDSAEPFELGHSGWRAMPFPMADYPRPIKGGDSQHRQSLISNRRLHVQSHHANMTARLAYSNSAEKDHVIYAQVNYQPWASIVECLHQKAQWVACVDQFVDKRLLECSGPSGGNLRKIVGFSSGLGAYGELNITLSSEQDTLKQLSNRVAGHLTHLLPHENPDNFGAMAARIVDESEEIIGLASLHAVVGDSEKIREVIGFSAILRALPKPAGHITQLVPLDSMQHWFTKRDQGGMRPDLIQLGLEFREGDIPLVHAHVIECKFAQKSNSHSEKARQQLHQGLRDLTALFLPRRHDSLGYQFDRRYWWAQLHRAISSRSVVNLSDNDWRMLDLSLEKLAEGDFEIRWQGSIYTFWTDEALPTPVVTQIAMEPNTVQPAYGIDENFCLHQIELGYQGVSRLFSQPDAKDVTPITDLSESSIFARPSKEEFSFDFDDAPDEQTSETDTRTGQPAPPATTPFSTETDNALSFGVVPAHETASYSEIKTEETPPAINNTITVPDTILLGTRNNGLPVYWHYGHSQLPNRHLLIFGTSGSGKTYGIQCFLAEMAKQQIHSLIIDYTDGFLPQQVERVFSALASPKNHFVITEKLPINPFRRQEEVIDPSIPPIVEDAYRVAARIASTFKAIFSTMGEQQFATLRRVIEEGVERNREFSLEDMLNDLLADESTYSETLANRLEPLIKAEPFKKGADSNWQNILFSSDHKVHTLQLKGLAREIQKIITEFALWDLWDYAQSTGNKNRPIPIVLDEIQNLDHSSDSPIDKMLREGRKFGLSMILATQTTSQFSQEQRDRLFQAGHKLFFKPATTEVDRFAQILSQATDISKNDWISRLSSLEKGQCWSLGPVLKSDGSLKEEAVLVNITALEKRQNGITQ